MNPMYAQMLQAQDPVEAQRQQMAAYRPAQLSPDQPQGQVGMSVQQMGNAVLQRKMNAANQVAQLDATGGY